MRTHYGNGYNIACAGLVHGAKTSTDRALIDCDRCKVFLASRERKFIHSNTPKVHFGRNWPLCKNPSIYPEMSLDAKEITCAKCQVQLFNAANGIKPVKYRNKKKEESRGTLT